MKISFDLDNLLIRQDYDFPLESLKFKFLGAERLRSGTREIIRTLRDQNHQVGVYTSSYRTVWQIRRTFWLHSIHLDFVVNGQKHQKYVHRSVSKYPPAFNIDLHVDDSEGVRLEGERNDFHTLVIAPDDKDWVQKIIASVK